MVIISLYLYIYIYIYDRIISILIVSLKIKSR